MLKNISIANLGQSDSNLLIEVRQKFDSAANNLFHGKIYLYQFIFVTKAEVLVHTNTLLTY
jgi:hypothetical protein